MLSLNARLLIAASIVLVAFLGLTGWALDRAFRESALTAVQDRLQTQIYMLLGAANMDESARLILPRALPEVRLSIPASGLYAWVWTGEGDSVWVSRSLLGMDLPDLTGAPSPGTPSFEEIVAADGNILFALSFTVSWEIAMDDYRRYTFRVAETREAFTAQVQKFRRSLGLWFGAAALVLLMVQGWILRWSLTPLREVAREVNDIEAGRRDGLTGTYPRELRPLTRNLNAFVVDSRVRLERYRNALADLAHSLKTPLAVMRGAVESEGTLADLRHTVQEQVTRMNQTVEYQLQRAAASGRGVMTAPVPVAPLAQKILDSLAKVYAQKSLRLQLQADRGVMFHGDEGDLVEILGNLIDNACKWAQRQVWVRALSRASGEAPGLMMEIEDDGPGIPAGKRRVILDRGERADPGTAGHGIGMAVVRDLVEEVYQGRLEIDTGPLGGARIRFWLQF